VRAASCALLQLQLRRGWLAVERLKPGADWGCTGPALQEQLKIGKPGGSS
jgi:hypothetical protein